MAKTKTSIIIVTVMILGLFISCKDNYTTVTQEVEKLNTLDLVTTVYYNGEPIRYWFDPIDEDFKDSIKAYRLKQGFELIKTVEYIENLNK